MKKVGKTFLTIALVVLVSVGTLFAAGQTEGTSTAAGGKTIVYWSMWNETEPQGQAIAAAIADFTKTTGIKVDANFNGRDIRKTRELHTKA
jgi:raffinose/stachyose/melibiose transport system substrate-binding protein